MTWRGSVTVENVEVRLELVVVTVLRLGSCYDAFRRAPQAQTQGGAYRESDDEIHPLFTIVAIAPERRTDGGSGSRSSVWQPACLPGVRMERVEGRGTQRVRQRHA